jgi:hypothetical protein
MRGIVLIPGSDLLDELVELVLLAFIPTPPSQPGQVKLLPARYDDGLRQALTIVPVIERRETIPADIL